MSENLDSSVPDEIGPITELPTTGPTFQGRQIIANRYEILSRLGKGGMGEVWHAYDLKLRVDVALKSLRLDLQRNDDRVEALRREVRTAREVISPNVCRIFDLVVEEDQELISMEYIDGITLTAMLVKKGRIDLREARDIAAQFLAGLEAIHQAGLIHRDLKPENIMITRTGRVVVMDFGIAKQVAQVGGTISGTLPYMSPEQLSGDKVDARSDVFSAGVVLAEMIHPEGVYSQKTRERIWNAVRHHPMQLPDTPYKAVIARAVAEKPENRFASASALARALEEVTQRVETIEERKPYPGLSSFSAADAEYFFGRELEVETVIKKLQQLHLMALIGPSGAGKTSFLRAGLIPALPAGWSHVFCTPGDSPLVNLGQSLVPELSGDVEAMQKMVRLEDSEAALWLLQRWSKKYSQALLIVDRFEELFTLNNPETQSRFAELLGHAALEADVRVLLTMRDDFLMHCHDHTSLAPIFSELTGLSPLGGPALRRALVQPALRCNYRFEDETLVDEILADVEKERGALPLMAFSAARLWEKRDRQNGQLTREAYEEIGGVAGALAQHAEETMERIGTERQPIVREIFRNLITAQNTRAARDTNELLSVFPEKQAAEEVLRKLIDARLLTSFEAPQAEGEKPKRRVEIIHESLLSNWPRLVRWQTQDADSAQLRDQLRQAAQLWAQRNRSQDLLWTGTAYLEFQAWRQRYPGGLTTTEEAFAQAMVGHATRKRRQRRFAIAAIFAVLLIVLAVISSFWRESEFARQQAVSEARLREAAQLRALGRLREADYPTAALAFAIASLERADTPEGRLFVLEAIAQGPAALIVPGNVNSVKFSPNGKWLATGGIASGVQLWSSDGTHKTLHQKDGTAPDVAFSPNSKILAAGDLEVRFWSVPDAKVLGMSEGVNGYYSITDTELLSVSHDNSGKKLVGLQSWQIPGGTPRLLSKWNPEFSIITDVDPSGKWIAYSSGNAVYIDQLQHLHKERPVVVGKLSNQVKWTSFSAAADHILASDQEGEIRVWRRTSSSYTLQNVLNVSKPKGRWYLDLDRSGLHLAAGETGGHSTSVAALVWNSLAPPDADPLVFKDEVPWLNTLSIHPHGNWLATANSKCGMLWPLNWSHPYTFHGQAPPYIRIAFTADGKHLISCSDEGTVRQWPLSKGVGEKRQVLFQDPTANLGTALSLDSAGKNILSASRFDGRVFLIPFNGSDHRILSIPLLGPKFRGISAVAIEPSGRLAATAQYAPASIRVWDIESKKYFDLDLSKQSKEQWITDLQFRVDGHLLSGGASGLRIWDLNQKSSKLIQPARKDLLMVFALNADGNRILNADYDEDGERQSELSFINLKENTSWQIHSHGDRITAVALDPKGQICVTGDFNGIVRVGPVTGEKPHLLLGHIGGVSSVAVSPDGKWIASGSHDGTIRLWPMPQGKPFHTLPYQELMKRLYAMTNLRVIADAKAETGYRLEAQAFPGWENAATW